MKPHRNPLAANTRRATLILLCLIACAASASDHKNPPPAKSADSYPALDTHPDERVTIAADPCDDPKQCSFFRMPYIQHALLPIRVIITNDSDTALQLNEARMQFISANNDKIP